MISYRWLEILGGYDGYENFTYFVGDPLIQAIGRPEEKNACCIAPGTLRKSTKYSSNTLPSMPHSGHTTKKQPSPAAIQKRGKTVKFHGATEEVNNMVTDDAPIQREKKGKSRQKILRVTRILQFHQRRNVLMGLTT